MSAATVHVRVRAAGRAGAVIDAFADAHGDGAGDLTETLIDLLTDLMHWSDLHGVDFIDALGGARMHHGAEAGS